MAASRTGIDALVALRDELSAAVDRLVQSPDVALPAFDDLQAPPLPPSPVVLQAAATSKELIALLLGPMGAFSHSLDFHLPGAMRVAIEAHVAEIMGEAAAQGQPAVHVDELAKHTAINASKLARVLRLLAANYIFSEVEPDTFALNRPALVLDTSKSVKELVSGTNGLAALAVHTIDDAGKSAMFFPDVLADPETTNSFAPTASGWNRAFRTDIPCWEYFALPGNEHLASRFGMAMKGVEILTGGQTGAVGGFPFQDLPKGAKLVGVGSGVGSVSLELAKLAPQVKLILQDRPEVILGEAVKVWEAAMPEDVKNGRVQLMPHDFFKPQPIKGADVYFMRTIIHDWADAESVTILSHLADAASPSSRLILCEQPYDYLSSFPSIRAVPPLPYLADMQMLVALNAQERTPAQYERLGQQSGWQLEKVWKTGPNGTEGGFRHYVFRLAMLALVVSALVPIFSHLADAASPASKLLLIEQPYDNLSSSPSFRAATQLPYLADM
ncbi:hypothetical protein JCM8097_006155 [Rhodosporidiobolus ruineniae]